MIIIFLSHFSRKSVNGVSLTKVVSVNWLTVKHPFTTIALVLAIINLSFSIYFRTFGDEFPKHFLETPDWLFESDNTPNWFFISQPIYNWGSFFSDVSTFNFWRLPIVLFLISLSLTLVKYLNKKRPTVQALSASILLGGFGGLTLDILTYGNVCDWLGFHVPNSPIVSLFTIADIMILVAAPVASVCCPRGKTAKSAWLLLSTIIIMSNLYFHFLPVTKWAGFALITW